MNLSEDIENPNAKMDDNIIGGLKCLISILR